MNAGHDDFRRKFALAVLTTVDIPQTPNHELVGSYSALRTECKRRGAGLPTLSKMKKPRAQGGLGRIDVIDDSWTFTASGISEYTPFIAEARQLLGIARQT